MLDSVEGRREGRSDYLSYTLLRGIILRALRSAPRRRRIALSLLECEEGHARSLLFGRKLAVYKIKQNNSL